MLFGLSQWGQSAPKIKLFSCKCDQKRKVTSLYLKKQTPNPSDKEVTMSEKYEVITYQDRKDYLDREVILVGFEYTSPTYED